MPIRAVIFDVGGVLFHQPDKSRHRYWEERLGLAVGALGSTVWQLPISQQAVVGLASQAEVWAAVASHFSLDPTAATALGEDYFSGAEWNVQLIEYARLLRARYKTGILSNAWPEARRAVQAWVNEEVFDDLVFSAEVGLAKPDRHIYELALDRLHVRPVEAIFIDDGQGNVEAAQAIGMAGIRFETTEQTITMIEQYLKASRPARPPLRGQGVSGTVESKDAIERINHVG
ncbi:FMN hydrolase / 5-amino-6-(5-phospho-D-ribitylamino)uracil phosphatase [Thermoflexales bacterium]|nr:FMN hydrolase / 5-amino-6-(5-phospho-D-ribitylamino)uracil phosphatase [Thermoflexales bacterium]